jgi:hypothetical protein
MRSTIVISSFVAALLSVAAARGELVKNISTGWDNVSGMVIDAGQPDSDYIIAPTGVIATVLPEAFPIPPWAANSATSKWIGFDTESSNADPIVYDFTTIVSMDGFLPETATISGQWSTDNQGQDILINGVSTGIVNDGNFGILHAFDVPAGLFQAGQNEITFRFENAPPGINPAGLRVEANVEAAVPEPTSMLMLALGFAGIATCRRRRHRMA